MRTTFQIIAALLTIGFTTAVWYGSGWLLDRMNADFAWGALAMLVLVLIVFYVSQWLDKSSSNAARTREHQGSRRTIDL